jgi:hypothetical protein
MSEVARHKPGPPPKPPLKSKDIRGAKYLHNILALLAPLHSHRDCPNRELHYDEYVAHILLYLFTPALTSLRGMQRASTLKKVRSRLGLKRFSLGSFSEASHVFDPARLQPILTELVAQVGDLGEQPKLSALDLVVTAYDGTLIRALPKMLWALWRCDEHRAAKMHLEYEVLKGVPTHATITDAHASEGAVLRAHLAPAKLYVLDRGYADYALMADIRTADSSFVVRLHNNAVYDLVEERPLTDAARQAGILTDRIVRLGSKFAPELRDHDIRLVEVYVRDTDKLLGRKHRRRVASKKTYRTDGGDYTLLLATDQLDLDVELIALLFRSRWQIELFFRWFKKVLEADHLLSLSQNGLTIVAYCALIASLLITLWTGRKPTKRTLEMLSFYYSGWADEEELAAHIETLQPAVA